MAILHANSGDPIDVRPLGAALSSAQSIAIFKSQELEVLRIVLLAGRSMKEHRVAGEMTLQCLEGKLEVGVAGVARRLETGQLLFLAPQIPHSVTALEDASALLTIVVRKPDPTAAGPRP